MKTAKIGYYFHQFNETVKNTQYFMEYNCEQPDTPLYKMYNTFAHLMFQHFWETYGMHGWGDEENEKLEEATLVINGRTIGKYECILEVKPSFMVSKKK